MQEIKQNTISEEELPFLLVEARCEKVVARVRFFFAIFTAFASLLLFAINKIDFALCFFQVSLLVFVCIYSGMFFFDTGKIGRMYRFIAFFSTFFDTAIVTLFGWTLYKTGISMRFAHLIIFPIYFLIIGRTALHNRKMLGLFAGFLATLSYILFSWFTLHEQGLYQENLLLYYLPASITLFFIGLVSEGVIRRTYHLLDKRKQINGGLKSFEKTPSLFLFRIDQNQRIIWNSPNKHFGVEDGGIVEKKLSDVLYGTERITLDGSPIQETFKAKSCFNGVTDVDCFIQPVEENEQPENWQGYMIDVSDRERAIKENEEMGKQLFQYKKMESLGTLASGMAHDFNNILQTISDIVERVSTDTKEVETRQGMELVGETLTDASFLISELLALGRKKPLNYTPMNITEFFRGIVPQFNEQIGQAYEVALHMKESNLWINGDNAYLKRVFQNLFGNARDAMPEGGFISIECFLKGNDGEDRSVIIRFSDSGIGIPENIMEKIFDPFYTTKKKGKGTGLGLALVKRIITLHKGEIIVENSSSSGTTFRIEIPEYVTDTPDSDTRAIYLKRLTTTIILLDDDPKIRNILNFFLTDLSYNTCEASTMNEGLDLLRKYIDGCRVLITDWKLKDADPHTVISQFRALKPDLIIIVISGYPPDQKAMKKLGIYRWLMKPYDKDRLDFEIQKALHFSSK